MIAVKGNGIKHFFTRLQPCTFEREQAGADVLVLFERDDKALRGAEGPLALIAGRDIETGPRHVKWPHRIEVKQIVA